VERHFGRLAWDGKFNMAFTDDKWVYDDLQWPLLVGWAALASGFRQ
jgi:hypothetical protein